MNGIMKSKPNIESFGGVIIDFANLLIIISFSYLLFYEPDCRMYVSIDDSISSNKNISAIIIYISVIIFLGRVLEFYAGTKWKFGFSIVGLVFGLSYSTAFGLF